MNLDEAQLHTAYRDGGWTLQQVIHHVADSHINAYCRFKLALTEDNPTVKPYEEKLWAEMNDVQKLPVNISLTLLRTLLHSGKEKDGNPGTQRINLLSTMYK